jgi:hypothetical protein
MVTINGKNSSDIFKVRRRIFGSIFLINYSELLNNTKEVIKKV